MTNALSPCHLPLSPPLVTSPCHLPLSCEEMMPGCAIECPSPLLSENARARDKFWGIASSRTKLCANKRSTTQCDLGETCSEHAEDARFSPAKPFARPFDGAIPEILSTTGCFSFRRRPEWAVCRCRHARSPSPGMVSLKPKRLSNGSSAKSNTFPTSFQSVYNTSSNAENCRLSSNRSMIW